MRQVLIFLLALGIFIGLKAHAQIKPAQAQYFKEKGVFTNPSFEQGYAGWTITGCSKDLVTEIPFMGKSLQLTCAGETFSIKQESTALAGSNLESFAGCRVKASASGVNYRTLANGSQLTTNAVAAGDFNRFEESFTADATSNGVEIYGTTYTGTVVVEDCFVGTTPDGYLADPFPDQTGNALKALSTNGTNPYWQIAEKLNAQTKDNLLSNPSFENGGPDGTVTVGSGIDLSGTTTRTSQESAHNASRFSILGSASDTIKYTYASTEDFTGSQMIAFCEYRTTRPSTFFRAFVDGVQQAERLLETDNVWRYVSIPFSGGPNPSFEISGDSATTEEISIDNCFIGKQSPDAVQPIDGDVTDWISFTPTGSWVSNATYTGRWRRVGDTAQFSVTVETTGNPTATGLQIYLPDGLLIDASKIQNTTTTNYTKGIASIYEAGVQNRSGRVRYLPASLDRVEIVNVPNTGVYQTITNTIPFTFDNGDQVHIDFTVPIKGWSSENLSAVSAESLSPDKAGFLIWSVFDGNIEGHLKADGACVKASDYPDYYRNVGSTYGICTVDVANDGVRLPNLISGNKFVRAAGGALTVGTIQDDATAVNGLLISNDAHSHTNGIQQLNSDAANTAPFSYTSSGATATHRIAGSTSTSGTKVMAYTNTDTHNHGMTSTDAETRPINIAFVPFVRMHDRNRILGTFDQIEQISGDLENNEINQLHVEVNYQTGGNPLLVEDQFSMIDSFGYSLPYGIVRVKKSLYSEAPKVHCNVQNNGGFNSDEQTQCTRSSGDDTATGYAYRIFTFRTSTGYINRISTMYFVRNGADFNKSFRGAVINASKSKTLCQTKYLSADVTSTGIMSDLTFSNLEAGKMYSIAAHFYSQPNGITGNKYTFVLMGGVTPPANEPYYLQGDYPNEHTPISIPLKYFKSTGLNITFQISALSGYTVRSGNHETWAQLCELPETTIETTKFD